MKFYYFAGLLFTVCSCALACVAYLGLFLSPNPAWLARSIVILSITLLAASTVIASAYGTELFNAYHGANAYEQAAFMARITDYHAITYWCSIGSSLVPQLFWFRRFRRRALPALLIALASAIPPALERMR